MPAAASAVRNATVKGDCNPFFSLSFSSPAVALAVLVGCLVLIRLPSIVLPYELNVDESQCLSQGMKFAQDPRPWKSVDSTTSGPLNSYPIAILLWMGFRPSYPLAHVVATVLVCLQLLVSYLIFLRLGSRMAALVGAILIVLFYGNTLNPDFLHYSSELFPILMLILGFYCFLACSEKASLHNEPNGQVWLLFLMGFLLGTVPWFKLQAGPIGAAVGLMSLMASLHLGDHGGRERVMRAAALCAGGFLPTVIMLAVLIQCGSLRDFWTSYILENLIWAGPVDLRQLAHHCAHVLTRSHLLLNVFGLASVLFLLDILRRKTAWISTTSSRWIFATMLAYAGGALVAVFRPNYEFDHYLQLLIFPLSCLIVMSAAPLIGGQPGSEGLRTRWISIVLLGALTFFCARRALDFHRSLGRISWPHSDNRIANMVGAIQKTRPVKSLAIWGWTPGVYVRTGIPPATRDSVAAYVITKGPLQPYFHNRFLEDLRDSGADLFIDSATPNAFMWNWTRDDGYESDPELKKFIQENYTLVAEVRLAKRERPVRFLAKATAGNSTRWRLRFPQ